MSLIGLKEAQRFNLDILQSGFHPRLFLFHAPEMACVGLQPFPPPTTLHLVSPIITM
jgi:hypothetical protein